MKLASLKFEIGSCALLSVVTFLGCYSRSGAKWELVHHNNMAHAAGVGAILFDNKEEGWALTWAELSKVRDKGRTWIPVLSNQDGQRAFYSFTFTTPTTAVVVGTQRKAEGYTVLILKTSDGGENWQEMSSDVIAESERERRPALHSVTFCGETIGWAVGEDLILHTKDGGLSWQTQHRNVSGERLFTVTCDSAERAWAAGTGGLLLRTNDGGAIWTKQETKTRDILMRVRFTEKSGWIVGGTNGKPVLLRTHDRGESWQPQRLNVSAGLFDIFILGSDGWISGENGTVLRSTDGGESWLPQRTPTSENITSLFFLSPDQGWAGGDRLTLLRFSDESDTQFSSNYRKATY